MLVLMVKTWLIKSMDLLIKPVIGNEFCELPIFRRDSSGVLQGVVSRSGIVILYLAGLLPFKPVMYPDVNVPLM